MGRPGSSASRAPTWTGSSAWPTRRSDRHPRLTAAPQRGSLEMKDHLRFVDSAMPIMEPPDLFERYLDPKFRERVVLPIGADGRPKRGTIVIDDLHHTMAAQR